MMICGVLTFERRLSLARLRRVIDERFLVFRRFRQFPVQTATGAYWTEDARFDLAHHVVPIRLPGRGDDGQLQALVSQLIATPLSRTRPMWQFHLIGNYRGGAAVVARIHHCYADGIALVRVMLSMTDASAEGPPAMPFEQRARSSDEDALSELLRPLRGVAKTAGKLGRIFL